MENLLQGFGIFACVGAILLVVLVVVAFRALTRGRNTTTNNQGMFGREREEPSVFNQQGSERPRYDTREVESRGGFGGVPQTGSNLRRERDVDIDRDLTPDRPLDRDRGGLPPLDDDLDQARGADFPARRRERDDDDEVRSRGGFGG